MEAWLFSIDAAVRHLRHVAGVNRIALMGILVGALLAGIAAARMTVIEALALLAPYSTGSAYVRDIKLTDLYSKQVITSAFPPHANQSDNVEARGL